MAAGAAIARHDVAADELPQLFFLVGHVVEEHVVVEGLLHEVVQLEEFLAIVVAGRHVPVEVVLVEHLLDAVVGNESEAGAVEGG